jgi:hypothetical protein
LKILNNIIFNGELLLAHLAPFLCCIMEGCVANEVLLVDDLVHLVSQATISGRQQEGKAGLEPRSIDTNKEAALLLMIWTNYLACCSFNS